MGVGVVLAVTAMASAVWAQTAPAPSRYELGQRLRRLERAVAEADPATVRQAILPSMQAAVQAFFAMQPAEVAKDLDQAYLALLPVADGDTSAVRAACRVLRGERFYAQDERPELRWSWPALYALPDESLADTPIQVQWVLRGSGGKVVCAGTEDLATGETRCTLPEGTEPGDFEIELWVALGDRKLELGRMGLSWIPGLLDRLAQVPRPSEDGEGWSPNTAATATFEAELLAQAFERQDLEMDLPAMAVLRNLERIANDPGTFAPVPPAGGEAWISLRGEPKGKAHLRIFAPARPSATLRPCVIALHGMGGSENLFFDGYGDGEIVRLCRERGWVLIAPRTGFAGIGMPYSQMIEALREPLGIDPGCVMLLGHSMGVSASLAALREKNSPIAYRALVALGGGMPTRIPTSQSKTRFLLMTGTQDFARRGVQGLQESLTEQGLTSTYQELEHVEHMGLVQFALPAAFAFLDRVLASPAPQVSEPEMPPAAK